jgi:hypothetical protein
VAEVWTTDELVLDIRRQGSLSPDDPAYSDANCIAVANGELRRTFVPAIRRVRGEWYVTHVDVTLVADQAEYRIPHRAATNSVRQVFWLDTSSRIVGELTPSPLGDAIDYGSRGGRPAHYTIKDDRLVLMPFPNTALGTLRIMYERRPSTLVLLSSAQTVTDVFMTGALVSIRTNGAETAYDTLSIDVVRSKPPFSLAVRDSTVTVALSVILSPPASWDSLPEVGDYVCLAGESCVPQIPVELHPLLALATAIKLLRPTDAEYSRELQTELDLSLPAVLASLAPRQQGKQQKLRSTSSYLRRNLPGRGARGGFEDWE